MEVYKKWVRRNKDYVHSLESLANGLTWLLPERFSETEIGPEAVTAILGIITAINEHIIDTAPVKTRMGFVESSSFPWPLCISALKDLETLVEGVNTTMERIRNGISFAFTEATNPCESGIVSISIVRDSGYKMLLHGGEIPNSEKGPNDLMSQNGMTGIANPNRHGPGYSYGRQVQNLEGRALSALSRFGENARVVSDPTWVTTLQHQHAALLEPPAPSVKRPTLSTILSERGLYGSLFLMAEVLHITRPLIYVLLIRKYGVRSWIPWLLSLSVELIGTGLLSLVKLPGISRNGGYTSLSSLEKNEVRRRKMLWALYLMRDPFFSKYTRQRFEKTEKFVDHVPVIGFLTAKLVELAIGAQTRYTYMSGS
ncbi:hypothetical protein IFM89_021787 [Coptis chinensis]|uniref:Peroxisomal membrane protein PEX16 n=1 Tax=Coptis chinensis TaxID=261450 RepID=A0A835IR84_9MAGN|nr:hypothetical protein IFM89_021787 [Coptis chinensis]